MIFSAVPYTTPSYSTQRLNNQAEPDIGSSSSSGSSASSIRTEDNTGNYFGFIEFTTPQSAREALKSLNGKFVGPGTKLHLSPTSSAPSKPKGRAQKSVSRRGKLSKETAETEPETILFGADSDREKYLLPHHEKRMIPVQQSTSMELSSLKYNKKAPS